MENFGSKFTVKLKDRTVTLRNVTEIHYSYTDLFNPKPTSRTAFESDIHSTGMTISNDDIIEFSSVLENKKAQNF